MAEKNTTKAAAPKATKSTKAAKKANEVKTVEQLHEELAKIRSDLQESRRSHRMGELVNPHVLTTQRKQVARALTAIKQAELAAVTADQKSDKEEN